MQQLSRGSWQHLAPLSALRLEACLLNGQSFQWRRSADSIYTGVLGSTIVSLREHGAAVEYATWAAPQPGGEPPAAAAAAATSRKRRRGSSSSSSSGAPPAAASAAPAPIHAALADYFQLSAPMPALLAQWAGADARMAAICAAVPGVRILRQPPFECLVSFVCSSNNNISRIGQMLDALRAAHGAPLGELPPELSLGRPFHAFPTACALASASEAALRALGVGYRAAFIRGTAAAVEAMGGEGALAALRAQPRAEVQRALTAFPGVGLKVADCVALFSLDQADALPVDTHVWAIACRDLDPTLKEAKSITPAVYARVGELFRARYSGGHAGWAHSVLFTAELPAFRGRLPAGMQADMARHAGEEKAAKAEKREGARARKLARQSGPG
jgi:N-glycosylase/DNA lyase